jgi:hypothetical protein
MKNTIRNALAILLLASGLLAGCGVGSDEPTASDETTAVTAPLINNGGNSLGYSCNEEEKTCSCTGGSLSSDCWLLGQYCIDRFDCRPNPPYVCTCHYALVRKSPVIKTPTGTVVNAFSQ